MIEITTWMDNFMKAIEETFENRVWFVGLQGSYGRGEATETSDVDIVVILDEEGNEVNYSTVDSTGEYYISGLAPGRYTVQLDERFVSAYGLEKLENISEREVFIPYDYDNPTDVVNQNLEYRTLSL